MWNIVFCLTSAYFHFDSNNNFLPSTITNSCPVRLIQILTCPACRQLEVKCEVKCSMLSLLNSQYILTVYKSEMSVGFVQALF